MRVSDDSGRRGCAVPRSQRASQAMTGRSSRARQRARPAPGRSRRRTGPRRTASARGSSRGAARARSRTTDLAAQWLVADHQVAAVEVELLDRGRERAAGSGGSSAPAPRQALDERRADPAALDRRRDRARHVDQREEVGARETARRAPRAPSRRRACPVSQSWTSATLRPVRPSRSDMRGPSRELRRRPGRHAPRPIAPTRTP